MMIMTMRMMRCSASRATPSPYNCPGGSNRGSITVPGQGLHASFGLLVRLGSCGKSFHCARRPLPSTTIATNPRRQQTKRKGSHSHRMPLPACSVTSTTEVFCVLFQKVSLVIWNRIIKHWWDVGDMGVVVSLGVSFHFSIFSPGFMALAFGFPAERLVATVHAPLG